MTDEQFNSLFLIMQDLQNLSQIKLDVTLTLQAIIFGGILALVCILGFRGIR